jgi:ribulose bisphosphate carboxylase small subunit
MSYSDSLLHFLSMDPPSATTKLTQSEEIKRQIEEFLESGYTITVVPIRQSEPEVKRTVHKMRDDISRRTWLKRGKIAKRESS